MATSAADTKMAAAFEGMKRTQGDFPLTFQCCLVDYNMKMVIGENRSILGCLECGSLFEAANSLTEGVVR